MYLTLKRYFKNKIKKILIKIGSLIIQQNRHQLLEIFTELQNFTSEHSVQNQKTVLDALNKLQLGVENLNKNKILIEQFHEFKEIMDPSERLELSNITNSWSSISFIGSTCDYEYLKNLYPNKNITALSNNELRDVVPCSVNRSDALIITDDNIIHLVAREKGLGRSFFASTKNFIALKIKKNHEVKSKEEAVFNSHQEYHFQEIRKCLHINGFFHVLLPTTTPQATLSQALNGIGEFKTIELPIPSEFLCENFILASRLPFINL